MALAVCLLAAGSAGAREGGKALSWHPWLDAVSANKTRVSVNEVIGAVPFYRGNVFGQGVRAANIETGLLWNGHVLFRHVGKGHLFTGVEAEPGRADVHATGVCGVLAGDSGIYDARNKGMGIAPQAELYSASFYAAPDKSGAPFTHTSLITAFRRFFGDADVINTSWGTVWPVQTVEYYSYLMDALCRKHPRTVFFAASGNTGNLPDEARRGKVSTIASGFNNIAVGALGNPPAFDRLYHNSSFKPVDFINPVTGRKEGVRAGVDLTAPGEGLVVPAMKPDEPELTALASRTAGTSVASPVAAGAAALLIAAAREEKLEPSLLDARLVKALLLNAADKPADWTNGSRTGAYRRHRDVAVTTQALDYRYGAGRLNLAEAGRLLKAGRGKAWQRDVLKPGESRVEPLGRLPRGASVTATLVWYQDCVIAGIDDFPDDRELARLSAAGKRDPLGKPELKYRGMADYALELWAGKPGDMAAARLAAVSDTPNNTVEHLAVRVPAEGEYFLRVTFGGMTYGQAPREGEPAVWAWSVRAEAPEAAAPEPLPSTGKTGASAVRKED